MSMPSDEPIQTAPFAAAFGDGKNATRTPVTVTPTAEGLAFVAGLSAPRVWRFDDLVAATPLEKGSASVVIGASSEPGATLFVRDPTTVAAIAGMAPNLLVKAERWRTLKPGLAVGAVLLAAGIAIWAFDLRVARSVAGLMPERARAALGAAALDGMVADRPRCIDPAGLTAIQHLHERLQPGRSSGDAITIVDWSLTNAFAVPGGRVVLTRSIIEKAGSADEVAGVLAHELGHGLELHPETGIVRSVGFWAALQIMFTGSPGTLANIGGVLAQLSYSREAEREADARAVDLLRAAGISAKPFAGFFRRMEKDLEEGKEPTSTKGRIMRSNDMLSSHPPSAERIAKIEAVPAYPATPALDDADWQALRKICTQKAPKNG